MNEIPTKPTLCKSCQALADQSNLHLVLCGGLHVGNWTQPKVWLLKDKDSLVDAQRRTKELQRLATAMRYLHKTLDYLPSDIRSSVEKFMEART